MTTAPKAKRPRLPPVDLGSRLKRKSKVVSIETEPLVINFDVSTKGVADAMLRDLKLQIHAQASLGNKWDHTGKLLNGLVVDASGAEIFAPDDRLDRAETRERFRVEVMRPNPFDSPDVDKALGKMLGQMIPKVPKVKK